MPNKKKPEADAKEEGKSEDNSNAADEQPRPKRPKRGAAMHAKAEPLEDSSQQDNAVKEDANAGQEAGQEADQTDLQAEGQSPVKCDACGAKFKTTRILKLHIKRGACEKRLKRKVMKENGFVCPKCLFNFKNKFRLDRHLKKIANCAVPNIKCTDDPDHEHIWLNEAFETEADAKQYMFDKKLDAQFKMFSMSVYSFIYRCGRRGKYKAVNFTKKNVKCGAYIQLSVPTPNDPPGKKVTLKGCLGHCHPLDAISCSVAKKDKIEMHKLAEEGVSRSELIKKFGAYVHPGNKAIQKDTHRKRKLSLIPSLKEKVGKRIQLLGDVLANSNSNHLSTFDALTAFDNFLEKALAKPYQTGDLNQVLKACGGKCDQDIVFAEGASSKHQAVQTDGEEEVAVATVATTDDQFQQVYIPAEEDGTVFTVAESTEVPNVVQEIEVIQLSPYEFVQQMLPNGTLLYKQQE